MSEFREILVVEFDIAPEHVESFSQAIDWNARMSLDTEPGCLQFDVCGDAQRPTIFYLYEVYEDEHAVQAHLNSAHFHAMDKISAQWVVGKTVRRLRQPVGSQWLPSASCSDTSLVSRLADLVRGATR